MRRFPLLMLDFRGVFIGVDVLSAPPLALLKGGSVDVGITRATLPADAWFCSVLGIKIEGGINFP